MKEETACAVWVNKDSSNPTIHINDVKDLKECGLDAVMSDIFPNEKFDDFLVFMVSKIQHIF